MNTTLQVNSFKDIHQNVTFECQKAVLNLQKYQLEKYGVCSTFQGTMEALFDIIRYNLKDQNSVIVNRYDCTGYDVEDVCYRDHY